MRRTECDWECVSECVCKKVIRMRLTVTRTRSEPKRLVPATWAQHVSSEIRQTKEEKKTGQKKRKRRREREREKEKGRDGKSD